MYNGLWIKKPWFWTERFLLAHKTWLSIGRLWIPIPFWVGKLYWKNKFKAK